MSMTVGELLDILEGLDENAEVRIAHQPAWAFEYEINDVVPVEPVDEEDTAYRNNGNGNGATVVYLVDGRQLGYLPSEAARQIGWKE